MFLKEVYYSNGHKEIVSYEPNKSGPFKLPEGAYGVKQFKYHYTHPILPPTLGTFISGKRYITPGWIEVHPDTQLSDIVWEKPPLKKPEKLIWKFQSASGNGEYTVTKLGDKLKCTCMGFWRSKGNCKHVKQVKKEL